MPASGVWARPPGLWLSPFFSSRPHVLIDPPHHLLTCYHREVNTTRIVTVSAYKGGVGKTTLAFELAASLGAALVDCDWDRGGASGTWGAAPTDGRLLRGLLGDRPPRPLRRAGRPDLVPSSPGLAGWIGDPAVAAGRLREWAEAWDRPVVIDTHPGAVPLTDAAWAAADVVVVPVGIGWPELRALEGLLAERAGAFSLILAPNRVRSRAAIRPQLIALVNMARAHGVAVAPPIGDYPWLPRRARRFALVLARNPGRAVAAAAADFRTLAQTVKETLAMEPTELLAPAEVLEGAHV